MTPWQRSACARFWNFLGSFRQGPHLQISRNSRMMRWGCPVLDSMFRPGLVSPVAVSFLLRFPRFEKRVARKRGRRPRSIAYRGKRADPCERCAPHLRHQCPLSVTPAVYINGQGASRQLAGRAGGFSVRTTLSFELFHAKTVDTGEAGWSGSSKPMTLVRTFSSILRNGSDMHSHPIGSHLHVSIPEGPFAGNGLPHCKRRPLVPCFSPMLGARYGGR